MESMEVWAYGQDLVQAWVLYLEEEKTGVSSFWFWDKRHNSQIFQKVLPRGLLQGLQLHIFLSSFAGAIFSFFFLVDHHHQLILLCIHHNHKYPTIYGQRMIFFHNKVPIFIECFNYKTFFSNLWYRLQHFHLGWKDCYILLFWWSLQESCLYFSIFFLDKERIIGLDLSYFVIHDSGKREIIQSLVSCLKTNVHIGVNPRST